MVHHFVESLGVRLEPHLTKPFTFLSKPRSGDALFHTVRWRPDVKYYRFEVAKRQKKNRKNQAERPAEESFPDTRGKQWNRVIATNCECNDQREGVRTAGDIVALGEGHRIDHHRQCRRCPNDDRRRSGKRQESKSKRDTDCGAQNAALHPVDSRGSGASNDVGAGSDRPGGFSEPNRRVQRDNEESGGRCLAGP